MLILNTPRVNYPHQLADSGAKVLVVLRHLLPVAREVLANTLVEKLISAEVGDLLKPVNRFLINNVIRLKGPKVDRRLLKGTIAFSHCLTQGGKFSNTHGEALPEVAPSDIAFLQYTGGTTGLSKGAILTHINIVANVLQISAFFIGRVEPGKRNCYYRVTAVSHLCANF